MQCEYYALEGLAALIGTVEQIREAANPSLEIEGLLRTMFDPRNNLANEVSAQLITHFGEKVFRTIIPRNIRLAEAPSFGKPVLFHDKESRGALSYLALAGEMIRREEEEADQAQHPEQPDPAQHSEQPQHPEPAEHAESRSPIRATLRPRRRIRYHPGHEPEEVPARQRLERPHGVEFDSAGDACPHSRACRWRRYHQRRDPSDARLPTRARHLPADEELARLPLDLLQKGKYQPRIDMRAETLQELADSIKAQGVIQPIVVRPVGVPGVGESQRYEIIAGERRWRAAQMAGLNEIPAVIRHIPDEAAIAVALIENIQRENLNPLEEARSLERLISEFELTHQEAADAVGRSRSASLTC